MTCEAPGGHCDVLALAEAEFGPELAGELLLNFTCFPFGCDYAMPQLRDLVQANRMGRLRVFLAALEDEQERSMYDAAGVEWPGAGLAPVGFPQRRTADGWERVAC